MISLVPLKTLESSITEQSDVGQSIDDLIKYIKKHLVNRLDLLEKLITLCYKTLGNTLDDSFNIKFDSKLAKSSIYFYHNTQIPIIAKNNIPDEILELKYKIKLDKLNNIEINNF